MLVPSIACQSTNPARTNAARAKAAAAKPGDAKTVAGTPQGTQPSEPSVAAAPTAPTPPTVAEAPPTPTPPAAPPTAGAAAVADPLGQHMTDPLWFRKTIFADKGTVLDTKRSEADDQGRFSSLMRFELDGMQVEGCADHLTELVSADVPDIERTSKDGRIQLTGNTRDYTITFMCGEAKGKTIAYVSYAWT